MNSVEDTLATRLTFLGLDKSALTNMAKHSDKMADGIARGLDVLYDRVAATPEPARYFGSRDQMQQAKNAQTHHWGGLTKGRIDDEYVESAIRIGRAHARIGVEPRWYLGGYALILEQLVTTMISELVGRRFGSRHQVQDAAAAVGTLVKVAILDMDYAISTYFEALDESRRETEEERIAVAAELAHSLGRASSAMEEMSASVGQTAENAKATATAMQKVTEEARTGGTAVGKSVEAMRQISQKVAAVQEVARQTDLLALNAAIEAARAGQHGASFSVVANEVRNLSERAAATANEIFSLAEQTLEISEEAGRSLDVLVPEIERTSGLIAEISGACAEQTVGVGQFNESIQDLTTTATRLEESSETDRTAGRPGQPRAA